MRRREEEEEGGGFKFGLLQQAEQAQQYTKR